MSLLLVVNTQSKKTATFWKKHGEEIVSVLPEFDILFVAASNTEKPVDWSLLHMVVLIGDDAFFSDWINLIYPLHDEKRNIPIFAFLADSKDSLIANDLGLPFSLQSCLTLIKMGRSVPFDLLRCHFQGKDGAKKQRLIINDAIIGIHQLPEPIIRNSLLWWVRVWFTGLMRPEKKKIQVHESNQIVFNGEYVFSILLLGNQLTGGPKIRSKIRVNLNHFEYFQFSPNSLPQLWYTLMRLLQGRFSSLGAPIFQGQFQNQKLMATGEENSIVADGKHIGYLPATITFLPKAIRVISAISTIRVAKPIPSEMAIPQPSFTHSSLLRD